jgi:hypothetical protein
MSGPRVQSFPPNRVCAECATVLSIYNETEFCSLHGRPRKPEHAGGMHAQPIGTLP